MLFNAELLGEFATREIPSISDSKFKMRPLEEGDYDKEICETLSQLSTVGPLTREEFQSVFRSWKAAGFYYTIVIEDIIKEKFVALGTLMIEQKILHRGGSYIPS
jgi:glucosamine-phosphate N-acetyltransferase